MINEHPLRSDNKALHGWSNLAYVLIYFPPIKHSVDFLFILGQFVFFCTDSFLYPRFCCFKNPDYRSSRTSRLILNFNRQYLLFSIIHIYNQTKIPQTISKILSVLMTEFMQDHLLLNSKWYIFLPADAHFFWKKKKKPPYFRYSQ